MITLKEWLYKNARFPILITLACMLLSWLVYFFFWQMEESKRQLESANQFVQLASLGIEQNNRTLLETALHNSFRNLKARELVFCQGDTVIISYPTIARTCSPHSTPFTQHLIELPAVGMPQYRLFLYVPRFPEIHTILLTILLSAIFLLGGGFLFIRFYRKIKAELLSPLIENLSNKEPLGIRELEDLRRNNQELTELRQLEAVSKALYDRSSQLAHDIRSPLTALDAALNMITEISERPRVILRQVSNRIHDLANSLLKESNSNGGPSATAETQVHLVAPLVEALVTEKRIQHGDKPNVEIAVDLQSSYGMFARIAADDINRVLSNIIDNAVDALDGRGRVTTHLSTWNGKAILAVEDNGKGIPEEMRERLMQKGETSKKTGKGYGLYFSKQIIEANEGTISIDSKLNAGTTVSISLPLGQAPDWFVPQLIITPGMTVVVVDDDPTIHEVWKVRFAEITSGSGPARLVSLLKPADLESWVIAHQASSGCLYLVDFEFSRSRESGISLISRLGIAKESILVTSRFYEARVLEQVTKLGIPLIPKSAAPIVPFRVSAIADNIDGVLIDDDPITREIWLVAAERAGKTLAVFPGPRDFFVTAPSIPRNTPVYVDVQLGKTIRGQDVAREIHKLGFSDISLTTAFPISAVEQSAWLREIRSKEPPWVA